MFKIVNDRKTDHHIHSSNFSDGINTIEEIVEYAGKLKMREITISDHSQATLNRLNKECYVMQGTFRYNLYRFKNVWNNVKVNFGIEADITNDKGKVCTHIQNIEGDRLILSIHSETYKGNVKKVDDAYEKAIEKYRDKLICVGHPFLQYKYRPTDKLTNEFLDVKNLCEITNKYKIPIEINGANLSKGKENEKQLKEMLEYAKYIMINSDAHALHEIKDNIDFAYKWLKKEGFL